MRTSSLIGLLAIVVSVAGCGDTDPAGSPPADTSTGIEIEGTWTSEFGDETISDDAWTTGLGSSAITSFSNAENVAVTLSPDDAEFSPGTYSRIVWTEISGGSFYYCTTDFALATEEEALTSSTVADATDPEAGGCGGGDFPWSKLTRK